MSGDTWLTGDALALPLLDRSVHCCVTSPPYFGLRDYGVAGQIGLEPTPDEFVARLVAVFREVRRVLVDDGTLWVNLGDSFWNCSPVRGCSSGAFEKEYTGGKISDGPSARRSVANDAGLKMKDLIGIPWMVAFALRADGWYLRSDIIWHKPNPMPESVTDRPTKAHEYLFLLSKSGKYHYDHAAIAEPQTVGNHPRTVIDNGPQETPPGTPKHRGLRASGLVPKQDQAGGRRYEGFNARWDASEDDGTAPKMRNKRDVWSIASQPFPDAHFATMPPELVRPCILAGCPKDGVVLDPFGGAGTVPLVARQEGRRFVYNDLNPDYRRIAERRLDGVNHQPSLFGAT